MIPPSALRGISLLEGLSGPAAAILARAGTVRRFAPGEVLFRAGRPARGLFVVIEGQVRVVREAVGRSQVMHVEGPGGTLGEVPLFTNLPYPATATAVGPTRCLLFSAAGVRAAIAADPELALALLARLGHRVRELIGRLDQLVFSTVRGRLARFLLARAERSHGRVVSLGVTQRQLAEDLGTVREVVVRELAALARIGAVRPLGGGRFEVTDRELLAWAASASGRPDGPAPAPDGGARGGRQR